MSRSESAASNTADQRYLLHGTGLPAQGAMVDITFGPTGLLCAEPEGDVEVPYARITTRPGGWNGESLLLEWDVRRGARSLLLERPERFDDLVRSLPADMRQRLEGWRRDVRRNRRVLHVSLVVVIAVTLLPLFAISVLMLNADGIATRAVQRVPVGWQEALGDQGLRDLHVTGRVRSAGPAFEAVQRVTQSLTPHAAADVTWNVLLVDDRRHDAVALPGGSIVLWSGLLREMRDENELAGVLAHSMQHVQLQHSLERFLRQRGLRQTLGLLLRGQAALDEVDARLAAPLLDLAYTRDQEHEARTAAAAQLQRAGWNTTGFTTLLQRLDTAASELPAILQSHPSQAGRSRAVAAADAASSPVAASWQAVLDDLQEAPGGAEESAGSPTPMP